MKWTDIVGHIENIKTLRHMEDSKCMPHAVLFSGPSGIGKLMVANVLAAALLCEAAESRPCGCCQSCLHVLHNTHPDLLLIRPEGNSIKIEQIRSLQQEAALAPYMSLRRICIIDGAEYMTTQAANSLLKVLEEPTGQLVFILLAANKQMLLSTILSRCMNMTFRPLTDTVLTQALIRKGFSAESSKVAARLSGGRMGTALSMLEPNGFALRNQAVESIRNLLTGSMATVWDTAAVLEKMERTDILQIVGYFTYILRDIVMIVSGQDRELLFNIDLAEELSRQADRWDEKRLLAALNFVETARQALQANANVRLTLEVLLMKIYELVGEV